MERELSLVEHLAELRMRIIISLVALGLSCVLSFPFAPFLLKILKNPALGIIDKLAFFSPQEAFLIYVNLSLFSGWLISMPVILYQVWAFISPAIEERQKKHIGSFIFFCFTAFICGGLFAYFILIPPALKFLMGFASDELEPIISAQKYISFLTSLIWGSGFVFQMPVLSFILTKLKIIHPRALRNKYKYAIVIIFILAAAITPTTDIFNMLMLAIPMLFLYELSIWVSFFVRPKIVK
jgi:sec-independent protein translocase protein TatC